MGGGLDPSAGLVALGLDALLLGFEDIFVDSVSVEELEELLLLGLQVAESAAVLLGLLFGDIQPNLDLLLEFISDRLALGVA